MKYMYEIYIYINIIKAFIKKCRFKFFFLYKLISSNPFFNYLLLYIIEKLTISKLKKDSLPP